MPPAARKGMWLAVLMSGLAVAPAAGADNDPTVLKGLGFLRSRVEGSQVGETALIALALLKADVPPTDPALAAALTKLKARFAKGDYEPERQGGQDIYEAGVISLALANLLTESRKPELEMLSRYILGQQKANGSWDYAARTHGDSSISQYAILGLWEAENRGVAIPPEVWEKAALWYIGAQAPGGSWNYHRDESGPAHPETVSMTAAGVGSLLICQRQLARYQRTEEAGSTLLAPVTADGHRLKYDVSLSAARIDAAVRRGMNWLSTNFTVGNDPVVGMSIYYGLYGIERVGALSNRETLGRVDWFDSGRKFIRASQRGDGAWDTQLGDVVNTAWAVLFLTKATAKTLSRIEVKPLGAGTLLGGRGLPKDLSSLTVAGGRVVSRPMNGAVEGMLAVIEDPRAVQADSALMGLIKRYRDEGPAVLKPYKDRFRKLLTDRDPGLRKLAAWSLARTGDLDTVPGLIETLNDADESVVAIARQGLELISRKVNGYGPTSPSTPEQRREAAGRWRAWYTSVRPLDAEGPDDADARRPR